MKAYQPSISVVVRKRIARRGGLAERVSGSDRTIDLTPFLGEGSSVQVTKSVRSPCGGFSISLSDQLDRILDGGRRGALDSLYAALEPMDYVEIRLAREPHQYVGRGLPADLPIVMRGFISDVQRNESLDGGGRPSRRVVISGQDYGKVPQIIVLRFRYDYSVFNYWLSSFPLFVKTGFDIRMMTPNTWMTTIVNSILNPWMREMVSFTGVSGQVPLLGVDASVNEGYVAPLGMQPFQGSMWNFITDWADIPWNEVFIEDRESGPVVVYRPTPFTDMKGKLIQGGTIPRSSVALANGDIQSINLQRSDSDVANFYWVEAPRAQLATNGLINIDSVVRGRLQVDDSPNCDPRLYGLREMNAQTNHWDSSAKKLQQDLEPAARDREFSLQTQWITRRREVLKRMNADNALLETGSMTVKGHEQLKPGQYVPIERGGLKFEGYICGLTHTFIPHGPFTTSLQLERCTSFLERSKLEGSPYLAEGAGGAYDAR